jgi:raffinose/stachyose/melibiose transport system permease protein
MPTPDERKAASAFVAPALAVYALVVALPIVYGLGMSLYKWDVLAESRFAGLANFAEIASDPVFWRSLGHNLILVFVSVAFQLPLALALAVILSGAVPGRAIFRTAYFLPVVLPSVVIALLWKYVLDAPGRGLLNGLLGAVGLGGLERTWLTDPSTALGALIGVVCWRHVGFHLVIYYAGIQSISEELYEAARVDGAGPLRRFLHVTLPGLERVIEITVVLAVVGSLKYFDLFFLMPGPPEHETELVTTYLFRKGIEDERYGYACALAAVLLAVSLAAAAAVLGLARRWRRGEA